MTVKRDQKLLMSILVLSLLTTACLRPSAGEMPPKPVAAERHDPPPGRIRVLSRSGHFTRSILSVAKAAGDRVFGVCAGEGELFELKDGEWTATDLLTKNNPSDLNSLLFFDASNGLALGNGGTWFRTSDGGANWTKPKEFTNYDLQRAAFVDKSTGYIVGERALVDSMGVLTFYTKIFRTTDGGLTWSKMLDLNSAGAITGLAALSDDTVIASFNLKGILRSKDKGRSWKFVDSNPHTMGIAFTGSGIGLSIDNHGNLYRSEDRGLSWEPTTIVSPEKPSCRWADVSADESTFVIVSSNGCVAYSRDGKEAFAIDHIDDRLTAVLASDGFAFILGDLHTYEARFDQTK